MAQKYNSFVGIFTPTAKVSVANNTFTKPFENRISITSFKIEPAQNDDMLLPTELIYEFLVGDLSYIFL